MASIIFERNIRVGLTGDPITELLLVLCLYIKLLFQEVKNKMQSDHIILLTGL